MFAEGAAEAAAAGPLLDDLNKQAQTSTKKKKDEQSYSKLSKVVESCRKLLKVAQSCSKLCEVTYLDSSPLEISPDSDPLELELSPDDFMEPRMASFNLLLAAAIHSCCMGTSN